MPLIVGASCVAVVGMVMARWPLLNAMEVQDSPGGPKQALSIEPGLVLVGIGKKSLLRLTGSAQGRIQHDAYARLLRGLDAAGARVAVIDVIFRDPQRGDAELKAALRNLDRLKVALATAYDEDRADATIETARGLRGYFYPNAVYDAKTMPNVALGSAAATVVKATGVALGGFATCESFDGSLVVRHLAFVAAMQRAGVDVSSAVHQPEAMRLTARPLEWRLQANQALLVGWPKRLDELPQREMSDALDVLADPQKRTAFAGATVVVGYTDGSDDTETEEFDGVPGPTFIANMVNTALKTSDERRYPAPPWLENVLASLLAAGAFATAVKGRAGPAIVGLLGFASVAWCLPSLLVVAFGMDLAKVGPTLAVAAAGFLGLLARSSFLFRSDHRPTGAVEEITAMFLDVRGSTVFLHEHGTELYRVVVGDLLAVCTKILTARGAVIERTQGDGLFAVFRPDRSRSHSLRAADSVAPLLACAGEVSRRHGVEVAIGIGFETGVASGGYVTEARGHVWSSAGKTVVLAQRLQSSSEALGTKVMIGPVAASLLEGAYPVRSLGSIVAKGFPEPVEAYTLDLV